jgi:hypothetical protein
MLKLLRLVAKGTTVLLILAAACAAALYLAARILLAPQSGEWAVPLRVGPLPLEAAVPTLVRLATAPLLAPVLDGRTLASDAGPLHLSWQESGRTLALRCAPCALNAPGLGSEPLVLDHVVFTLQRQGEQLSGQLSSGSVIANWSGSLQKDGLRVRLQLTMTPIADIYALFGASIPELAKARIDGRFGLSATLSLPGNHFSATPEIEGFQVGGLDSEALISARPSCSSAVSRLTPESWLSQAVHAAQDQRPDDQTPDNSAGVGAVPPPGQRTPSPGQPGQSGQLSQPGQESDDSQDTAPTEQAEKSPPEPPSGRGSSTLSQQLARLLVGGDVRSPARKLRELLYAVEMERIFGKPRILEIYLAQAPWGSGVCGAEAASRRYFGVRADVLTPQQAAWLAAMLHDPELEAGRWASTGQINVALTQWVLQGMQTLPPRQRLRMVQEMAKVKWKVPTPKPPPKPKR